MRDSIGSGLQDSAEKKPANLGAWFALLLGCSLVWFAVSSYPMMRPGFDVWWHLGMIEAPAQADEVLFPTRRLVWHHAWHHLFFWLNITDVFARALLIHRVQLLLTVVLLVVSAYLLLRVLTQKLKPAPSIIWTAALLSTVIWLLMHGTHSVARGGGVGASVVQSWPLWYSVTYQISLPLYFAATACVFFGVASEATLRKRIAAILCSLCLISIGTIIHAAETAYFLVCLALLALAYVRRRNFPLGALVLISGGTAVYWLASQQSYAVPALLTTFLNEGVEKASLDIMRTGAHLVNSGRNRADTGWHAMHWISLLGLLTGALLIQRLLKENGHRMDWRPVVFVGSTALLPALLTTHLGAGLFAHVTHQYIAWRFALASLLFVGLPLGVLVFTESVYGNSSVGRRAVLVGALTVLICSVVIWLSKEYERKQPSFAYAQSLARSLNPQKSYFGLTAEQRSSLEYTVAALRTRAAPDLLCTDLFSAYYLFFVARYREVHLPSSLEHIPGYRFSDAPCKFPLSKQHLNPPGSTSGTSHPNWGALQPSDAD